MTTSEIAVRSEPQFGAAEIGALAHLYRGEMYRSKVWRTRLDATTNWAVVTTGIAMSVTFSSAEASVLPVVLVSLLVAVFLIFEGRRYRYFDIWRTRVRVMEVSFYGPILRGQGLRTDERLEPGAGRRLHRPLLPHQLPRGGRAAAAAQLLLDLRRADRELLGQGQHPSDAARLARPAVAADQRRPALGPGRAARRHASSTSACSRSAC